jgi:putative ABC transport system permease protein
MSLRLLVIKQLKRAAWYADPSILSMYTLPFMYGDAKTALNDPHSVVISESMSKNFLVMLILLKN